MLHERWRMRRTTRRQLMTGGLTVAAPLIAGMTWPVRYIGRLYPGATLLGMDLGGLTRAEAASRVETHLGPFLDAPVTFRTTERTWKASATDLGLRINLDATFDEACRHGRGASLLRRYATLLDPDEAGATIPVIIEITERVLLSYFQRMNDDIVIVARDASVVVDHNAVTIVPAQIGRRLDTVAMREAVLTAVSSLQPTDLSVVMSESNPEITAEDWKDVQVSAARMLSAPVEVTHGDDRWHVATNVLRAALVLPDEPMSAPTLNHEVLISAMASIADDVNHPPQNASVAWDNGLYATSTSTAGAEVDLDALATAVAAAAMTAQRSVALPLISSPPEIDADNLDALGITERLAVGSSSFAGSSEARSTNIRVAAEHVSHTLIPPGDIFSFNDTLGPISLDQGYVEGKIISGDWYADDLGGGVCQVSTTVYRAALLAGLPFAEWHPHSFRLSFYELDGWPAGMDAAIYQPNTPDEWELDLSFANPTEHWMLLQMRIDETSVAAELYGAPTGYEVALSDPEMSKPIPPPEPIERISDELAAGEREQMQAAHEGVIVTLVRTVTENADVVSQDTFVSEYEPQPEIWFVGSTN